MVRMSILRDVKPARMILQRRKESVMREVVSTVRMVSARPVTGRKSGCLSSHFLIDEGMVGAWIYAGSMSTSQPSSLS